VWTCPRPSNASMSGGWLPKSDHRYIWYLWRLVSTGPVARTASRGCFSRWAVGKLNKDLLEASLKTWTPSPTSDSVDSHVKMVDRTLGEKSPISLCRGNLLLADSRHTNEMRSPNFRLNVMP